MYMGMTLSPAYTAAASTASQKMVDSAPLPASVPRLTRMSVLLRPVRGPYRIRWKKRSQRVFETAVMVSLTQPIPVRLYSSRVAVYDQ